MPDSMGTNTSGFYLDHTTSDSGDWKALLKTENKFVDKDIAITITTPAATAPVLNVDAIVKELSMGTATNGVYSPTVTITGDAAISTAGWITAGSHNVSDTDVPIGTVNQSTISNGGTAVADGATITPTDSNQTITISEGYNVARTIIVGSTSTSQPGEITSGASTIDTLAYTYNTASDNFTIAGSADVSAPTVVTPGYISTTSGIKNANPDGAVVAATVDKIAIAATLSGATTALKPTLEKEVISITGVVDASSGNAQSTAPTSGVYVAVKSAANTATITATPGVTTAGYGDTTNYGATNAVATVGAAQSDTYYVPITTTTATVNGGVVSYDSGWINAGSINVGTGSITSGAGVATISSPAYDSENSVFTQTAAGAIAAPTVNTAGYISATEGTKTGNNISGSKTLNVVQVGVEVTGTTKVTPQISRWSRPAGDTWIDAASGASTTTKPTSGPYVQVIAGAVTSTITSVGKVKSEGYGTTEHYLADAATETVIGTNNSEHTYIPIKLGSVTSGRANIDTVTHTYDSSNGNFTITGVADVAAPSFTEGYLAESLSSINPQAEGATLNATVAKIGIQANLTGSGEKVPVIEKNAATNMSKAGTATTTQPGSGYYIAVGSAADTETIQATASVVSAGYGTTTSGQYTTTPSASLTVGAAASAVTYVPVSEATFANAATTGITYTDISATAPVLISGDYLYINEGYTGNSKISLAQLIPDASGANAPANYILSGYTAFDNNGALITGTMQTYGGEYEIV